MRIASLLPAATEIAAAIGLTDDLVAVTYECDHPPRIRDRCRVVVDTVLAPDLSPAEIDAVVRDRAARRLPLYTLDAAALAALDPELILTQDLCRVCALPAGTVDDALATIGCTAEVLTIDPRSIEDVLAAIRDVGRRGGAVAAADDLVVRLRRRLAAVRTAVAGRPRPRVLVLEWTDPPYLAGHWVPELVERAGGQCVGGAAGERSVAVGWSELAGLGCDAVLVAPCGYGLAAALEQAEAVRARWADVPIIAVDSASYVVRAGPRLVDGVEALAWALHPDAVAEPPAGRVAYLS